MVCVATIEFWELCNKKGASTKVNAPKNTNSDCCDTTLDKHKESQNEAYVFTKIKTLSLHVLNIELCRKLILTYFPLIVKCYFCILNMSGTLSLSYVRDTVKLCPLAVV